ncbi:MAG: hypothetical protein MOB07_31505 [Acidobacteria bacterium]|nr:hypothetical protein [Acidobacteriota bacterium]
MALRQQARRYLDDAAMSNRVGQLDRAKQYMTLAESRMRQADELIIQFILPKRTSRQPANGSSH